MVRTGSALLRRYRRPANVEAVGLGSLQEVDVLEGSSIRGHQRIERMPEQTQVPSHQFRVPPSRYEVRRLLERAVDHVGGAVKQWIGKSPL